MKLPSVFRVRVPWAGPATRAAVSVLPSMSASLARTLPLIAVSSSVPAVSSVATGASLTDIILTVVLPVAVNAPPVPCPPLLPSLKVQLIWIDAGGASLLLA